MTTSGYANSSYSLTQSNYVNNSTNIFNNFRLTKVMYATSYLITGMGPGLVGSGINGSSTPDTLSKNIAYTDTVSLGNISTNIGNTNYFIYANFNAIQCQDPTSSSNGVSYRYTSSYNTEISDFFLKIYFSSISITNNIASFKWWIKNVYSTTSTFIPSGYINFVIFFYTPTVSFTSITTAGTTLSNSATITATAPSSICGYQINSVSLINNCPIVSFSKITISHTGSITNTDYYGSISIKDYNTTDYIILTSLESGSKPTFNTRSISSIITFSKNQSYFYYFFSTTSTTNFSIDIIFIIFYNI